MEPDVLISAALVEVARGARWIKVVADWTTTKLSTTENRCTAASKRYIAPALGSLPMYNGPECGTWWRSGLDSIEHGCLLDAATIEVMAARGVAWTPTLTAFNHPLPDDAPPELPER